MLQPPRTTGMDWAHIMAGHICYSLELYISGDEDFSHSKRYEIQKIQHIKTGHTCYSLECYISSDEDAHTPRVMRSSRRLFMALLSQV